MKGRVPTPKSILASLPPVIVDTREQTPFSSMWPDQLRTVRRKLDAGDYSLEGHDQPGPAGITLERKSLGDLVSCLTIERRRFMACLERMRSYGHHALLIEAEWNDIVQGGYRSKASPSSLVGSIAAIMADGTPVIFAGDAFSAADFALRLLSKMHNRAAKTATDPLAGWEDYATTVRARLGAGREAYGDRSFGQTGPALVAELQQELADVCGWGFILHERLRRLSVALNRAEAAAAEGRNAA